MGEVSVTRRSKWTGGPAGEKNKSQGNLFDWAETVAAKLGRKREDFAVVSDRGIAVVCGVLFTAATNHPAGSVAWFVLMAASAVTAVMTLLSWWVSAYRSEIEPGSAIAIQGGSIVIAGLIMVGAFGYVLYSGWTSAATQAEEARIIEGKRAEAAQKEALRQVEERRVAEQEFEQKCQTQLRETVDRAKRGHRAASTELEACKGRHANLLLQLQSLEGYCKAELAKLESAARRLEAAMKQVCATGTITKGQ